jgi:hypothetical protein
VPPRVGADDKVGVSGADLLDERDHAPDLLGRGDVVTRLGGYPANVEDVGALGHDLVHPREGGGFVPRDARPEKRVRRPVHDRHH